MNGKQQVPIPGGGKGDVKTHISCNPKDPGEQAVSNFIHFTPYREIVFGKLRVRNILANQECIVNIPGMHHHFPDILEEMRRVGVFFSVTVCMVHSVHYRIGSWYEVTGTLKEPG
jgi:hypothetical protein